MKTRVVLAVLFGLGLSLGAAWCQTSEAAPAQTSPASVFPWQKAQTALDATNTDVSGGGGFSAIRKHVDELEAALATADDAYKAADTGSGTVYVLTDGLADTLDQLTGAASQTPTGRTTVAVRNPYPAIALYLGAYYNEVEKFQDALRVLDKGLALYGANGAGQHQSSLISERAIALTKLGRMAEALAAYQAGLKLAVLTDRDRARLYRGCGFTLTELGSLDEAETAYNKSLEYEPGNKIALGELHYIAELRSGGEKAPPEIVAPGMQKPH